MNVIIINDNAHINGGAAKVAIQEAAGLAYRGHHVFFACAVRPVAQELHHSNIRIVCSEQHDLLANPNPLEAFIQGWWNTKADHMIKQLISELSEDETVIHLHVWSRALSASIVRSSLDGPFPVICTLHDFLLACPTATFFDHSRQEICHLQPLSPSCLFSNCDTRSYSQKLWRVGRQIIQKTIGHAPAAIEHVIVHSNLAGRIMQPYLPSETTVHNLPIYIESTRSGPSHPETNDSFLYIGRLVREKGVMLAARAASAEDLPITFVGSGPLADEIRVTCPKALITGWVDHITTVQHLQRARALVFPSLWYETLGLVVLEAAAQGVPSIVPDTSAACEFVVDGVTGLHFRSGDERDLRAKMLQLKDATLVSTLGRAAYDRFWSSDYPMLEAHIDALEDIYQKILSSDAVFEEAPAPIVEVQSVG